LSYASNRNKNDELPYVNLDEDIEF
jgi:hypothetical protein